jgi:hypothetical protein
MNPLDKLMAGILLALGLFYFTNNAALPDTPGTPPIPGKGLRVLFIEETGQLSKLPKEQRYIAQSKEVAEYCNEHCAKESTGQAAMRLFDPEQDVSHEQKSWREAMKNPHDPPPWLMVSDGRKGVSRPLPKTLDETMTVLKKYGK